MNPSTNLDHTSRYSQARILIEIEDFVTRIAADSGGRRSFDEDRDDHPGGFSDIDILSFMQDLPRYLTVYTPDHDYSEHIQAFWEACEQIGALEFGRRGILCPANVPSELTPELVCNFWMLARHIAALVQEPRFRRRISDRRYEMKVKREGLEEYVREVLDSSCRTLVVRVDLGYRTASQGGITVDRFYGDITEFQRHRSTDDDLSSYCTGWAICLEQGRDRGFHAHVCVFYHGSQRHKDGFIATLIGEMWEGVTQGEGTYYNVNIHSDRYRKAGRLGVGMIERDDARACDNCVSTICYLAELDKENEHQHLRIRPSGRRTFFTGVVHPSKRRVIDAVDF